MSYALGATHKVHSVPHGAVAYVYVHGQDMVYARRLVLVHRCVASYMMLLVMLHIYRNVWDNNAPRVGAWPYLTGCVIYLEGV